MAIVTVEVRSATGQDQGDTKAAAAEVQGRERTRLLTSKEQFEAIQSEYKRAQTAALEARKEARTAEEKQAVLLPDFLEYGRRFLALAEAHPDDLAARDALMWIIRGDPLPRRTTPSLGAAPPPERSALIARAVDLLIDHHANDLQVARAALGMDNFASPNRDRLLPALYEKARDRDVKGTATLALAQYLLLKASLVANLRKTEDQSPVLPEEYEKHLRGCDPEAMKAEAERLLDRVVVEYGDVPYVRGRNGTQLDLARKWTLSRAVEAKLDQMHNLGVGKKAPEIDGVDIDGKPLKLSDYRGKVVVLVFWGSWCGPCMVEVPHERALVERLKGQPFALLGIDCRESDKDAARKVMERERMSWPNWYDNCHPKNPGGGGTTICERYHIRGYPTTIVLDANGIIRFVGRQDERLDQAVDQLLKEVGRSATTETVSP